MAFPGCLQLLLRPELTADTTVHSTQRVFELLMIEDSSVEAILFGEAWQISAAMPANLVVLTDPRRVSAYLQRTGDYAEAAEPDLILLDYKMPVDGSHVLELIRADPTTTHLPVLVITGVEDPDVLKAIYSGYANCCLQKPETLDGYVAMTELISRHWLEQAQLPSKEGNR